MSLTDAAYNLAQDYPGGAASLAPRVGKSASTLSHELKNVGTAKLGLETAKKMTDLSGDLRILAQWNADAGQMMIPLPSDLPLIAGECAVRMAATIKEFGDFLQEVAGDLADGSITDNELARINRESGHLMVRLHALRESLCKLNQDSKPAHLRAVQ